MPQHPISPYGRSKLIGEDIIRDHATAFGIPCAILRYFNACGADPDGGLAGRQDPETHLIPRAILAAKGDSPDLTVFGDGHPSEDGSCVRDYI